MALCSLKEWVNIPVPPPENADLRGVTFKLRNKDERFKPVFFKFERTLSYDFF